MDNAKTAGEWRIGNVVFLKPRLIPVVVTVLLVGMCLGLGIWQVQRLQWKEALIASVKEAQQSDIITNTDLPDNLNALTELKFHAVNLEGVFDYSRELHVIGRSAKEQPGYHIITPFRIAADDRWVYVNRGWVPQAGKEMFQQREARDNEALHRVRGFILVPQGGSPFLPDHDTKGNIYFFQDVAAFNAHLGVNYPNFVVQAVDEQADKDVYPQPRPDYEVFLRNDHFAYSCMWFALALSGTVIFVLYHRKREEA